jgi:hypothetical protein
MPPTPAWLAGRLTPEPAASRFIYNTFFKYSPNYMTTVLITATFAGLAFDAAINSLWDFNNKGVSGQLCAGC